MKDNTYFVTKVIEGGHVWEVILEHTTSHLMCQSARVGSTDITVEYLSYVMNPELEALFNDDGWIEDEVAAFLTPGMFGLPETVQIPVVGHVS